MGGTGGGASGQVAVAQTAAPPAAAALDEVMLAMDVVDTLRHEQMLIEKELGQGARDGALKDRLREIYASQGITVPDSVLEEGIRALKDSRFTYTPPPPSLQTSLAKLYVTRGRWGRWIAVGAAALVALWVGNQLFIEGPRRAEEARAGQELAQTLPSQLQNTHTAITTLTANADARAMADAFLAEGRAALAAGDAEGARKAVAGLTDLFERLRRTFILRIVQGERCESGVFRIPDANRNARNYYVIVEAVDQNGETLRLPITSEETGQTKVVRRWGLRVDEATFNAVRADKQDHGIIQSAVVGKKKRGDLDPVYRLPVAGGAITEW